MNHYLLNEELVEAGIILSAGFCFSIYLSSPVQILLKVNIVSHLRKKINNKYMTRSLVPLVNIICRKRKIWVIFLFSEP